MSSAAPHLPYQPASATSRDAAERARAFVGPQGERVRAWYQQRGAAGGTQAEASAALSIGRPSICARTRALEELGQLVKTEARRQGCAVYRWQAPVPQERLF